MTSIELSKLNDIPEGTMKRIDVGDTEVLLANVNGKLYAINNRCGHMNAPLSMGTLRDRIVECPLHHAQFDVTTGKVIRKPQLGGVKGKVLALSAMGRIMAAIKTHDRETYQVSVEDGVVKFNSYNNR